MDTKNTNRPDHLPFVLWNRGLAPAARPVHTIRRKHSIIDSASHHMQLFQRFTRMASTTNDTAKANGFSQKAASHRKAAILIYAFIDTQRTATK